MNKNSIQTAIDHVQTFYPDVMMVIFGPDGRWQYMDEDFKAPIFEDGIDVSILEAAADSLEYLPAIFVDNKYNINSLLEEHLWKPV